MITVIDAIDEQLDWIIDHGGNLAGYIKRYGSASDPDHYGDGGEAIYAADMAELSRRINKQKGRS